MNILYARAWYSKALALYNLKNQIGSEKNFGKALEAFDSVLEINPEDTVAWQYRGNSLRYLDRPEEAIEAFERALAFDPDNFPALYFKRLTFGYLSMPERALDAFEGVLKRDSIGHRLRSYLLFPLLFLGSIPSFLIRTIPL